MRSYASDISEKGNIEVNYMVIGGEYRNIRASGVLQNGKHQVTIAAEI